MKQIELTQGLFAQVDDEDYDYLNQWKWSASKDGHTYYAVRHEYYSIDPTLKRQIWKSKAVNMHRLLLGLTDPKVKGDHKDRNGLNNQRNNIRIATSAENNMNRKSCGVSKYLGVSIKKNKSTNKKLDYELIVLKWKATINTKIKNISLGAFPYTPQGEILAAKAYDAAAKIHHKEFANLNFK